MDKDMTYFVRFVAKKPNSKKITIVERKKCQRMRLEGLLMNIRSFTGEGYNVDLTVRANNE